MSCCFDLSQSPPFTNDKLKNQRTKERQADVGFGSSLTDKHNNFCPTVMNHKLSNGIAGNEQGLAFGGEFEKRPPVTTAQ